MSRESSTSASSSDGRTRTQEALVDVHGGFFLHQDPTSSWHLMWGIGGIDVSGAAPDLLENRP